MSKIKGILQVSVSGIFIGMDMSVKSTLSGDVTLYSLQILKQLRPTTEGQSDFLNWNKVFLRFYKWVKNVHLLDLDTSYYHF